MIRTLLQFATAVLIVTALVALPGCGGSQPPTTETPATQSGHYGGDGHDHSKDKTSHHEGDGHDHGDHAAH